MTKNYTIDDLVRLLYKEVSQTESALLQEELYADFELREDYNALLEASRELPRVSFSPRAKTIENILAYSRSTAMAH